MTLEEQSRRYRNDAEFHALVKQFRILMEAGQFSIGECKGALNLAAYLVNAERIEPLVIRREGHSRLTKKDFDFTEEANMI